MTKVGNKTVWILNHHATNTFADKGGRHYELGKGLIKLGYAVRIVCASSIHGSAENYIGSHEKRLFIEKSLDGITYTFVKARSYAGNGLKRVVGMFDYYRHSQRVAKKLDSPDVVIGSSVHPLACVAAIKIGKRKRIPCICEIRDLWPESLIEYGLIGRKSVAAKVLYRGEHWIYEHADALIFTMEGGKDYLVDKGWADTVGGNVRLAKVNYINNGVNLSTFNYNRENHVFTHHALARSGKAKIIYAGSIRAANDIGFLVDVADAMRDDPVEFVVVGDGDQRERLVKDARNRGLDNICFIGRIDKSLIPSALSQGAIMMMYSSSQTSLSRYGMSQNKLFDYLAAGKPIISNLPSRYSVVNGRECGIERRFADAEDCASQIREMLADRERMRTWGENARRAAEDYSYERHAEKLAGIIEEITR